MASSNLVCVKVPVVVARRSSEWSTVPCPAARTAGLIGTLGNSEIGFCLESEFLSTDEGAAAKLACAPFFCITSSDAGDVNGMAVVALCFVR